MAERVRSGQGHNDNRICRVKDDVVTAKTLELNVLIGVEAQIIMVFGAQAFVALFIDKTNIASQDKDLQRG
jgi:hypothetical protein